MKKVITGIVAAVTLLSAVPAFAIDVDIGPNGIRVGPTPILQTWKFTSRIVARVAKR